MRARLLGCVWVASVAVALSACGALGFTDRVLHRVPSPDGRQIAVCQEVPVLDGPTYDVRLERPDGTLLRKLGGMGDGDPCDEMAWSPDGRTLAVLTADVARMQVVDVAWALDHPSTQASYWFRRQIDLWSRVLEPDRKGMVVHGQKLRFVAPLTVELQLCPYRIDVRQRDGKMTCTEDPRTHRFDVPLAGGTGAATSFSRNPPR